MIRLLLTMLACAALGAASPSPSLNAPARIVAVGDLHGDAIAWQAILRDAGLVDSRGHWSGGRTVLVQTGDVTDRGPDSLKIIHQLMALAPQAERAGGRVVSLVGNHEGMQVLGDLRYIHPGELAAFVDKRSRQRREAAFARVREGVEAATRKTQPTASAAQIRDAWMAANPLGRVEHDAAWAPTGELGRWLAANPAVVKIGDSLFVHGGLSAAYAAIALPEINGRVTAALAARDDRPDSILNDPLGPLWYRGLITRRAEAGDPPAVAGRPTIDEELALVLRAYGVRRIVVGHTPRLEGVSATHDGKLVRIDTGISAAYGGTVGYLEILGDRLVPHSVPRPAGDRP